MIDDERRDHTYSDEALDRLLVELGPLMRRQERAEADLPDPPFARPDPAFELALRQRLFGAEPATTDTETGSAGASPPSDSRARDAAPRPVLASRRRHWYQRPGAWIGLAAILGVALLVSVVVAGPSAALAVLGATALAAVLVIRARLGQ